MDLKKILFICAHNSGRSQMAEAFANQTGKGCVVAESAGLDPKPVLDEVIEVMEEVGLDVGQNTSDSVFEFYKQGRLYDYVIAVCEDSVEKQCPIFPGFARRLSWPFDDPEKFIGTPEEKKMALRQLRDLIHEKVSDFVKKIIV
jgi:arsenate reductase (thioredoxin)